MVDRKAVNFALWTCVVMLALAPLSGWPYGYYTLLRWVVFLTTGYLTYENYQKGHKGFSFILGAASLLFNPIAPITMARETWQFFDVAGAAICGIYAFRARVN